MWADNKSRKTPVRASDRRAARSVRAPNGRDPQARLVWIDVAQEDEVKRPEDRPFSGERCAVTVIGMAADTDAEAFDRHVLIEAGTISGIVRHGAQARDRPVERGGAETQGIASRRDGNVRGNKGMASREAGAPCDRVLTLPRGDRVRARAGSARLHWGTHDIPDGRPKTEAVAPATVAALQRARGGAGGDRRMLRMPQRGGSRCSTAA